jgi:hypothetical protein
VAHEKNAEANHRDAQPSSRTYRFAENANAEQRDD